LATACSCSRPGRAKSQADAFKHPAALAGAAVRVAAVGSAFRSALRIAEIWRSGRRRGDAADTAAKKQTASPLPDHLDGYGLDRSPQLLPA
jgi:hypothetical protein